MGRKLVGGLTVIAAACAALAACSGSDGGPGENVGTLRQKAIEVPVNGGVTTIAGGSTPGNSGDGGPATAALLNDPAGVAIATDGTMYVADWGNNSVRRLATNGTISSFVQGRRNLIKNARAEQFTGNPPILTDWTIVSGQWIATSKVECSSALCGHPYDGSRWFWGGQVLSAELKQVINLSAADIADLLLGPSRAHFHAHMRSNVQETARVRVEYWSGVNGTGALITAYDTGEHTDAAWTAYSGDTPVPSSLRSVVVRLYTRATAQSSADAYIDGLNLRLIRDTATPAVDDKLTSLAAVAIAPDPNNASSYLVMAGANDLLILNPSGTVISVMTAPRRISNIGVAPDGHAYIVDPTNPLLYVRSPSGVQYFANITGAANEEPAAVAVTTQGAGHRVWATFRSYSKVWAFDCPKSTTAGAVVTCPQASGTLGGSKGFVDDLDGTATGERFATPQALAWGKFGDLLIGDEGNHAVRRNKAPLTLTSAGTGSPGHQDGASNQAKFWGPSGVAAHPDGSIIVADRVNNRLRKIACAASNVCQATSGMACPVYPANDNEPCTTDSCMVLGVNHVPLANGTLCRDSNPCNGTDRCNAVGVCVAGPPPSLGDEGNPCTAEICDPVVGPTHTPLPAGTPCWNYDNCTTFGTCSGASAICQGGVPLNTEDNNPCTADSCDPLEGVVHTPTPFASCGFNGTCSIYGTCDYSGSSLGFPALDATVPSGPQDSFGSLYGSGSPPYQRNPDNSALSASAFDPNRIALVRGRVANASDAGLQGVKVTIPGYPQYGQVITNSSGEFFMAVNGGGSLPVRFELANYLTAEREVHPEWGGTAGLYSVLLVSSSGTATPVTVGTGSAATWVAGPSVSETVGGSAVSHKTSVFFPAGTIATSSTGTNLTSLPLKIIEYTVGPRGAESMPADIANNTVYTYASEFSVGSTIESVSFSKPVFAYVENFMNVAVGTTVPSGYYDRVKHIWVPDTVPFPAANAGAPIAGRVVQITGGVIDAASKTYFSGLGADYAVTTAEEQKLAPNGYTNGTLWRMPLLRFSPHDFNFSGAPPKCEQQGSPGVDCTNVSSPSCVCPDSDGVVKGAEAPEGGSCQLPGSTIDAEEQVMGEQLPIGGTPYVLSYRSNSVPGYMWGRTAEINFDGFPKHSQLQEYRVRLEVGGTIQQKTFSKNVSGPQYLTWDGNDFAGRKLYGSHKAAVDIGAVYPVVARTGDRFMDFPIGTMVEVPGNNRAQSREIVVWQRHYRTLHNLDASALGFGGWMVDVNHRYDPEEKVLYLGDGSRRAIDDADNVVSLLSGGNSAGDISADGTLVTAARFPPIDDMAVAANGDVYLAALGKIQRLALSEADPSQQKVYRIAGGGATPMADGGDAKSATLWGPLAVAVSPDGVLYFASSNEIWRVDLPDAGGARRLKKVAGGGTGSCDPGSGKVATAIPLCYTPEIAVSPDGSIFMASHNDAGAKVIKRVDAAGTIKIVAGGGTLDLLHLPSNAPPTSLRMGGDPDVEVGPDGSLWFTSDYDIYRIYPNGRLIAFGSRPPAGYINPYCPQTATNLPVMYFASSNHLTIMPDSTPVTGYGIVGGEPACDSRVWQLSPVGKAKSILGTSTPGNGPVVPGSLSSQTTIERNMKLAAAPDAALYFFQNHTTKTQLYRSGKPAALTYNGDAQCRYPIPSADGTQFFCFDADGRHWKTIDSKTKAVIYTFLYTSNQLSRINDAANRATNVTRSGSTITIKGPYGHSTVITKNGNYASTITDAANFPTTVVHDGEGLLTRFKPFENSGNYSFVYDDYGRLVRDIDPESGYQVFDTSSAGSLTTVTRTTAQARTSSYSFINNADGSQTRTVKRLDGLTNSSLHANGVGGHLTETTLADGTKISLLRNSDAQWGSMAPIDTKTTVTIPTAPDLVLERKEYRCHSEGTATCPEDPTTTTGPFFTSSEVVNVNGRKFFMTYQATSATTGTYTLKSAVGRVTKFTVDKSATGGARITSVALPGDTTESGTTTSLSYASGQLSTISQGGRLVTLTYFPGTTGGSAGYLQTISDPDAAPTLTTIAAIDGMGRPQTVRRADVDTLLNWDASGRLASVTPPDQPVHDLDYTQIGFLKQYTPPPVTGTDVTWNWEYSPDRELEMVRRSGLNVDFIYDAALGRLKQITSPEDTISVDYYAVNPTPSTPCPGCAAGRLKTAVAASSGNTTTFAYAGAMTTGITQASSATQPNPWSVATTWTYDNNLMPTTEKVQKGTGASTTVTYTFDNDGVLTCASLGTCAEAKAFTVTPWTKSWRPNILKLDTSREERTFNTSGELKSQVVVRQVTPTTTSPVMSLVYDSTNKPRDAFGRVTDRDETVNGVTKAIHYEYDDFGRLLEVLVDGQVVGHYEYDNNGNRRDGTSWKNAAGQFVEGSFVYDDQDRLLSFTSTNSASPSVTYEYTPSGALKRRYGTALDMRYTYDSTGGLRSVTTPNALIEYTLDAFGRRVGRKKNGSLERQWVYASGLSPIAELDAAGTITKRFIYATGRNVPDFMVTPADNVIYRILADQLGSVRLVVNANTGEIKQDLDYDAFGNVLKNVGTDPQFQPFGFAGGLYDPDTQLVRFGVRDYDASIGRWVNKDPILFDGKQTNLYVYVGNDPINVIDPKGLFGDYVGWTVYGGSPVLPWVAGLFGYTLPGTVGVSVGIFKDVDFSSGDVSLGFYFTKSWTVDAPTASIVCNAGTEVGLHTGLSGFKGKSEGIMADMGPFAGNVSWAPGSNYLTSLPTSAGGNLTAGPGAFAGWTNSDTSIVGVSGGLSGVKTIR